MGFLHSGSKQAHLRYKLFVTLQSPDGYPTKKANGRKHKHRVKVPGQIANISALQLHCLNPNVVAIY